jgi:hypothetical protein
MESDSDYLERLRQLSAVDEPGVATRVLVCGRRFALFIVLAAIIVPILAVVAYYLLLFCAVVFALIFGDYPFHESEVLREAGNFIVEHDPSFRVQDHDATIRWVGGRTGAWEIYFTHKTTRQRKCVRWVNCGFLYGYTFEWMKCPSIKVLPSG